MGGKTGGKSIAEDTGGELDGDERALLEYLWNERNRRIDQVQAAAESALSRRRWRRRVKHGRATADPAWWGQLAAAMGRLVTAELRHGRARRALAAAGKKATPAEVLSLDAGLRNRLAAAGQAVVDIYNGRPDTNRAFREKRSVATLAIIEAGDSQVETWEDFEVFDSLLWRFGALDFAASRRSEFMSEMSKGPKGGQRKRAKDQSDGRLKGYANEIWGKKPNLSANSVAELIEKKPDVEIKADYIRRVIAPFKPPNPHN